jgi:hypothetical protein
MWWVNTGNSLMVKERRRRDKKRYKKSDSLLLHLSLHLLIQVYLCFIYVNAIDDEYIG